MPHGIAMPEQYGGKSEGKKGGMNDQWRRWSRMVGLHYFLSFTSRSSELSKTWLSVPVKAGVLIGNRFEVYGTYWHAASLAPYYASTANLTSYQAGINYIFGKKTN